MKEYHPDKVDNMGEKLKDLAEKESKMINEAYEYFKKKNRWPSSPTLVGGFVSGMMGRFDNND